MGTDGDGIEVVRGWAGMEVKVDGDGWGWKQILQGWVGMGVIFVPVQVLLHFRAGLPLITGLYMQYFD